MACPTRRSPAARCSPPRRRAAPSAARCRSLLVMVPKPSWSLYRGRARGRERVRPNERAVLKHTTTPGIGGLPSERELSLAVHVTAYLRGVGTGDALEELDVLARSRTSARRSRSRSRDHSLRRCGRPAVWAPGPNPTGATGVMAPFTHGKGNQHPHRGDRGPRWSAAAARTPMCVPMTRVERARGDRIVAVARSILVIAHALSRRPVLSRRRWRRLRLPSRPRLAHARPRRLP
jgi:hypothetical protein